jgi:hypothetical protein
MSQIPFQNIGRGVTTGLMIAVALLGMIQPASAASIQTFFGIDQGNGTVPTTPVNALTARNSFVAEFTSTGIENFDSFAVGSFPSLVSFPSTSITANATNGASNFIANGPDNGAFATSGTQFLDTGGSVNATFTFNAPVAGVGLYVSDMSDGGSAPDQLQLLLTLEGGGTTTVTTSLTTANSNANVFFFGVASTDPSQRITAIQITNSFPTEGDVFGMDDLTIGTSLAGTATPEPGSFTLLATSFAGLLALFAQQRRHSKQ